MQAVKAVFLFALSLACLMLHLAPLIQPGVLSCRLKPYEEAHFTGEQPFLNLRKMKNYHKITGMDSWLHKLHWTSLAGNYHFVSAYYDNREGAPETPAVVILGYFEGNESRDLYCVFTNSSGAQQCFKNSAHKLHLDHCIPQGRLAKVFYVLCEMQVGESPPVSVQLSTSNNCDPKLFSGEIPVRNRNTSMTQKPPKKFGVCVGGPLVQEIKTLLRDVIEFVEMSKLMGAELIVFYVNETQVDLDVLQYIWTHYPDTVRTVGWKKFNKYGNLRYYGQQLIISDCFYRLMYEVDYLAQIDLDEMIIPLKADNWSDMVAGLNRSNHMTVFEFQNTFFQQPNPDQTTKTNFCGQDITTPVPRYFTRTKRLQWTPNFRGDRAKTMSRPRYVLIPSVHKVCGVPGYKLHSVSSEVALLGHFRNVIPKSWVNGSSTDMSVLKYFNSLQVQMCPNLA